MKANSQDNEESGCDEKDENIPAKIFTTEELWEILCNIESTQDKILEVDPNLESSMTLCYGIKKMSVLHYKLYD